MNAIIDVEQLSKVYRIGLKEETSDTLVGAVQSWIYDPLRRVRRLRSLDTAAQEADSDDAVWALRDVSFEIEQGEVVGIIGRNGAGKSTLLRILSGITDPTSGRAVIRGRVGSLLEVGTGFHPEMTGRENVYMNGTILGMSKREIDRKFDEIVAFSGVERFLDTPIKRYSSGMQVRLAFAVAAHLDPEILIVDEVLAVGDTGFQKKCLARMREVGASRSTVLFVSHDMAAIEALCERVFVLEQGRLALFGTAAEAIDRYREFLVEPAHQSAAVLPPESGDDDLPMLREFSICDASGSRARTIPFSEPCRVNFVFDVPERMPRLLFMLRLFRADNVLVSCVSSRETACEPLGEKGRYEVEVEFPGMLAFPDCYSWTFEFRADGAWDYLKKYERLAPFEVTSKFLPGTHAYYNRKNHGVAYIPAAIKIHRCE